MATVIHYLDSEQVIATRGPLVMRVIARAVTEPSDVDRVFELMQQVASEEGEVGVMVVVHHGAPIPGPTVLRHIAQQVPRAGQRSAAVFVMLGLGLWAMAAQRSVVAIARFAGISVPVTTELDAGAVKLARHVPGIDAATVIATYETIANKMTVCPSGS